MLHVPREQHTVVAAVHEEGHHAVDVEVFRHPHVRGVKTEEAHTVNVVVTR